MTKQKIGTADLKQDDELKRKPGRGQSKGASASGEDLEDAKGEDTVEGDIGNDPEPTGGINLDRKGRTNE